MEKVNNIKIKRIGVTLFMVNSDKTTYGDLSNSIDTIFKNYRVRLHHQYLKNNDSPYYQQLSRNIFGFFDRLFIFCHDDQELNNLYLQPQSTLLNNNDELFDYKSITGNFANRQNKSSKDLHKGLIEANQKKYFFLTRVKINSLHLFSGGGKTVGEIETFIENQFQKYASLDSESPDRLFIVESFGFHEIVILSFWDNTSKAMQFLLRCRDLSSIELEKQVKGVNPLTRSSHIFDLFSSTLGVSDDTWKNGELKNSNLIFSSIFGIKPGYTSQFLKSTRSFFEHYKMDQKKINFILGWQDVVIEDFYKDVESVEQIYEFFETVKDYIDNSRTLVIGPNEENITESQHEFERPKFEKLIITNEKIKNITEQLKEIGVNLVVIQRCVNSILNFNKSITERENFAFFIQLQAYLDTYLIKFINFHYSQFLRRISKHESIDFFSIPYFEDELIKIIKGFETSFTNRYIHSKELSEITDTNYAYKGGIQQYLFTYGYLYTSMYQAMFKVERPGVTLYVTGYSQTVSWDYYMRMNIFQVNNPGLFLTVLTHEVVIHIYDKLLLGCFLNHHGSASYTENAESALIDLYKSIATTGKDDFLTFMSQIGYDQHDNPYYKILFSKRQKQAPTFDQVQKEILKYLLTDMITLSVTFLENKRLFLYWHLVYFYQSFGSKRRITNKEYQGSLRTLIARFYLLLCHVELSKNSSITEEMFDMCHIELRKLFKELIPGPLPDQFSKAIRDARNIFKKANELHLLKFLKRIHQQVISNFKPVNISDTSKVNYTEEIREIPIQSREKREEDIHHLQRELSYCYLDTLMGLCPKIKILNEYSQFINYKDKDDSVIISYNGSTQVQGNEKREKAYLAGVNYLSNMWHLGQLSNYGVIKNLLP